VSNNLEGENWVQLGPSLMSSPQ